MNSWTDGTAFVESVRRSFGQHHTLYHLLRDASRSGIFLTGHVERLEDGSIMVEVGDPGIIGEAGRHRLRVGTEPLPHMHCDCPNARFYAEHCRHMCWLLLRAGQLNTTPRSNLHFWHEGIISTHARLLPLAAPPGAPPPMGFPPPPLDPAPPRPNHDDVSPPDATADCPICFEPFQEAACVRCSACPAHFHRSCAARWGKSCPMCRDPHQFADLGDPTCTDPEPADPEHLVNILISVPPARTPLSEASEARARSLRAVVSRYQGWDAAMANFVRAQLQPAPDSSSPPRPPSPPSSMQQPIASQLSSTG